MRRTMTNLVMAGATLMFAAQAQAYLLTTDGTEVADKAASPMWPALLPSRSMTA